MSDDTRIRRSLEGEAGRFDVGPDLEDLRRRLVRRSKRRTLGTTVVGVALGAVSVAAALSLVGPLGDIRPPPGDRAGSQTTIPEEGLPEGTVVIQRGSTVGIVRTGSDEVEELATDVFAYDVSADGPLILAVDDRALVTIDSTGERRVLTEAPPGDHIQVDPRWSPDGSSIAYGIGSQDPAVRSTLCVLVLATGESTCYPEAGRVYWFDWSPDGRSIVLDGPPSDPVMHVDLQTDEVSEVVAQGGDTPINRELEARGWGRSGQLVAPIWSPSGRYLAALASMETGPYAYVPVVFTPDGVPVAFGRPSTEFPYPIAWSPTVDILAYPQGEAPYRITDVYLLDPTTGSERRLVTSGGKEYPHVTDLVWSPSGRWVAVTLWWAEGGYLREAHRILDSASGELVQEFDFDTEDVTEPLVDWGP